MIVAKKKWMNILPDKTSLKMELMNWKIDQKKKSRMNFEGTEQKIQKRQSMQLRKYHIKVKYMHSWSQSD